MPTHMAFVNWLLHGVCLLSLLNGSVVPTGTNSRFKGQEDIVDFSCTRQPYPSTRPLSTKTKVDTLEVSVTHSVNMFVEQADTESLSQNSKESSSVFSDAATCNDSGGGDGDSGDGCEGGGSEASDGDGAAGYQLVPYKPNPILSVFHEVKRLFIFGGVEWTIHQQWNDVGLASVVWEAALLLSRYLEVLGPSALRGRRVIELGAGTGLVGFVASSLGAKSVVLTDKNTGPAQANLKANQNNLINKDISVAQFDWGTDPSSLEPPFDVVLAADVIYIEETYPLLLKSLVELSDRDTVILISCKRRYERDDRFFDLLRESGKFSYNVVWAWPKEDPRQPENDVKVYQVGLIS